MLNEQIVNQLRDCRVVDQRWITVTKIKEDATVNFNSARKCGIRISKVKGCQIENIDIIVKIEDVFAVDTRGENEYIITKTTNKRVRTAAACNRVVTCETVEEVVVVATV